ncbi:MAG: InlB B-repeat-containing protein [Paludibacteraceae bacterium]|nr:InlB B-repeat-containing protein [Paludibacteraceae bacterium]
MKKGLPKILTLFAALTLCLSAWGAYYTPTADEVIIIKENMSDATNGYGTSTHSAFAFAEEITSSNKQMGSASLPVPDGSGKATYSTYKLKGNGGVKNLTLSIAGCSKLIVYNKAHSSRYIKAEVTPDGESMSAQTGTANTTSTEISLNGKKSYTIFVYGYDGSQQDIEVYAFKLVKAPDCDDPEASFTVAKTVAEINEEVALTFSSSNTNAVSYSIKKGGAATTDATVTDGKFKATVAGTYVVTAIQDADAGGHCAVEKIVTIKVASLLTGWVIFDGLVDEEARTSPVTYNTVSMEYETSTVTIVDAGSKTLNGTTRAYSKLMQIAKSTGGYLKFTIPDGYSATFTHAFSGTGNRTIILASAKINSTSSEGYIATLCSATSGTIKWGEYTTPLAAGDYYICDCNNGNWQIAELVFNLVAATKYTVTYDLNGGSGTTPTETDKAAGAKFNLHNGTTSITAPTDKEFSKWVDQDANEYDGGAEFTMPGKNVTLTAKWVDAVTRYTVTYDLNGGEGDAPTETDKAAADVFALAAAPTRAGYNFTGWLCDIDGAVKAAGANYTMTAENTKFTAQWEAYVACYTFAPTETSGTLAANDVVATSTGGEMKYTPGSSGSPTLKYTENGVEFGGASSCFVTVTLNNLMKVGTQINITLYNAADTERGLSIRNSSGTAKGTYKFTAIGNHNATYTVVAGDGLAGSNEFRIYRENNSYLKSLTVSNCGAELIYYDLTSAVNPTGMANVTLSASSLLEGETATATYSDINDDYEFDEWMINGATIDNAKANPVTITMGSNDAIVTLKLKEKAGFAVTYKANNGTAEADVVVSKESTFAANTFTIPEGKMFAGWNTQADGEGTNYAVGDAVTAATTVYAKWVVDSSIRLIKSDGTLNTVNFVTGGTLNDNGYTVEGVEYPKHVRLGGTCNAIGSIDNYNKTVMYSTTTDATNVKIALYDPYSSSTTHHAYIIVLKEGEATPVVSEDVTIVTNTKRDYLKEYNLTGRSTIYVMVSNTEVRVCQISVEESGSANAVAPAVGYSVNLNKGRLVIPATGTATSFEGLTYSVTEKYQPSRAALKIKSKTTEYISFEIPTGQTRQLQLTASGSYNVSETLGDESAYVSGDQNFILTAGTWYINPNGSNVSITNIAFAAPPTPDYTRTGLSAGKIGTLFVGYATSSYSGATFYELAGKSADGQQITFEEVTGQLEADKPYIFEASADHIDLYYADPSATQVAEADHNGLYGVTSEQHIAASTEIYYFSNNQLYKADTFSGGATDLTVAANRCYIKIAEVPGGVSPKPGRKYISLHMNGGQVATGIEDVQSDNVQCTKVLINGTLFILRGEKMYDTTGRFVK